MELLPEWAPGIHPLIVHFPIALLTVAAGFTVFELFYAKKWIANTISVLYVLGTLGALVSYISGRSAADSIGLNLKAEASISTHSDWAFYTLVYFGVFTLIYFALKFVLSKNTTTIRILLAVLAVIGFFLLAQTAEYGGSLVFKYGLGVSK